MSNARPQDSIFVVTIVQYLKSRLILDRLRENNVKQTDNIVYFIWLFMGFTCSFFLNMQKYESIMIVEYNIES